jgi:hypothetical protein
MNSTLPTSKQLEDIPYNYCNTNTDSGYSSSSSKLTLNTKSPQDYNNITTRKVACPSLGHIINDDRRTLSNLLDSMKQGNTYYLVSGRKRNNLRLFMDFFHGILKKKLVFSRI